MKFYFPAEKLVNCPLGLNLIPMKKVEDNPPKYRPDVGATPFGDYSHDIISISHPEYIDKSKVKEVTSYILMHCNEGWLVVDQPDGKTRLGLTRVPVNRGEEQKTYSLSFSSIDTGNLNGQQPIVIMGFFNDINEALFIGRFDFEAQPVFISSPETFRLVPAEYLLSEEFTEKENLDALSKRVATSLRLGMLQTMK